MKGFIQLIVVLGVLGGIGYGVYYYFFTSSEERACMKLARLCGGDTDASSKALQSCEDTFKKLEKLSGDRLKNVTSCIQKADNCARAVGCTAGAALSGMQEFLKGVKDSL